MLQYLNYNQINLLVVILPYSSAIENVSVFELQSIQFIDFNLAFKLIDCISTAENLLPYSSAIENVSVFELQPIQLIDCNVAFTLIVCISKAASLLPLAL